MTYLEVLEKVKNGIRVNVSGYTIVEMMDGRIVIGKGLFRNFSENEFTEQKYSEFNSNDFKIGSWTGYSEDIGKSCKLS